MWAATHRQAVDSSDDWLPDLSKSVPVTQEFARITVLERLVLHFLDIGSSWGENEVLVTR